MKLPFTFSIKLVFRLLLPGFIIAFTLLPLTRGIVDLFMKNVTSESILAISTVITGWIINVLDMNIYMLAEGRRYWPNWLKSRSLFSEKKRLQRLQEKYKEAKENNPEEYKEISVDLRRFPTKEDGEFYAGYPTRLGNLLLSYEDYPNRAYGMDSIFYWYRIWLALDENTRETIDSQQAMADSTLYVTFSLYISSLVLGAYYIVDILQISDSLIPIQRDILLYGAIFNAICGYILYRLSLHIHSTCGDMFKAMFDMYKHKVSVDDVVSMVNDLTGGEALVIDKNRYRVAWRYLNNDRIKLRNGVTSATNIKKEKNQQ